MTADTRSVGDLQVGSLVDAARIVFVLRRDLIQGISSRFAVEQHSEVPLAEVFDDPRTTTRGPDADIVPNFHMVIFRDPMLRPAAKHWRASLMHAAQTLVVACLAAAGSSSGRAASSGSW